MIKMLSKNIFIVFSSFVFFILLVGIACSESCTNVGEIKNTQFCNTLGNFEDQKATGQNCLNNYECKELSCSEGICQSKYSPFSQQTNLLDKIFNSLTGENQQCDPKDQSYHCEGTVAYLCGVDGLWEKKGEIPGQCGYYETGSNNGGGGDETTLIVHNNDYGGGGSGILIRIVSPQSRVYSEQDLSLEVYDDNNFSKFWKYSLNSGPEKVFSPPTYIHAELGENVLKIMAFQRENSTFRANKSVVFSVVEEPPTSWCGDGVCDIDESSFSCLEDCPSQSQQKNYLWLWIVLGVIVLLLILLAFYLISRKIRNRNLSVSGVDEKTL